MTKPRVLVAYDGSASADAAVEDLLNSGIEEAEALVVSVAEHWLPEVALADVADDAESSEPDREVKGLDSAAALASHAAARLRSVRPGWSVNSGALSGSPAPEILKEAERFGADLIVIGSRGQTAHGVLVIGGIAQKIVGEARCSVRIGRGSAGDRGPHVVAIGFDGSPGSYRAVREVASRDWGPACRIWLITASEEIVPAGVGRFGEPDLAWAAKEEKYEREILRKLADSAFRMLRGAGCEVELSVNSGNPRQVLAAEADRVGAHCLFVGASSASTGTGRSVVGSTAAAAAARAECSVEVVRSESGEKGE